MSKRRGWRGSVPRLPTRTCYPRAWYVCCRYEEKKRGRIYWTVGWRWCCLLTCCLTWLQFKPHPSRPFPVFSTPDTITLITSPNSPTTPPISTCSLKNAHSVSCQSHSKCPTTPFWHPVHSTDIICSPIPYYMFAPSLLSQPPSPPSTPNTIHPPLPIYPRC